MTKEQECIAELYLLIDELTEKAVKKDSSLLDIFRPRGISGCDAYQGMPPICRIRDSIFNKYEEIIYQAIKEKEKITD